MNKPWDVWLERHRKYKYMTHGRYDYRITELAKALGVTRMTVHRWIKGHGAPKQYSKAIRTFIRSREE